MATSLKGSYRARETSKNLGSREQRAHAIVANNQIVRIGDAWLVPSLSNDNVYRVSLDEQGELRCSCADFKARRMACKHVMAASLVNAQQSAQP